MAEIFFGNQSCEKNWFYLYLEPCFVHKFSENGQKVKFVIFCWISTKIYFWTKSVRKADLLGLEIPSEGLNAIESRISHYFINLTKIQQNFNLHLLTILVNFLTKNVRKSWYFRLRNAYWITEYYRIKNFSLFHQFDQNSTKSQSSLFDHFHQFFG